MTSAQVEQFLSQLNGAWLEQDYAALGSLYHPDVVLLPPDAGEPIEGRESVCESYQDFHAVCAVQRFEVTRFRFWNFTAEAGPAASGSPASTTVHMHFAIDYEMRSADAGINTPQSEVGLEVYTLLPNPAGENLSPQIVWRAQFAL